jgi:hypothetical protein
MTDGTLFDLTAEYWKMVGRWKAIIDHEEMDELAGAECASLLNNLIDCLTRSSTHRRNPPLRLWLSIYLLREHLAVGPDAGDRLWKLAIFPANRAVNEWLQSHVQQTVWRFQ